MATINLSEKTKKRFKLLKLKFQADKQKSVSENDFIEILLNRFEDEYGNIK